MWPRIWMVAGILTTILNSGALARAIEFDLRRGRHGAVVTVKAKGEVTLVGPFRIGKVEGPCLSFPVDSKEELEAALGDFLERFLELAMSP